MIQNGYSAENHFAIDEKYGTCKKIFDQKIILSPMARQNLGKVIFFPLTCRIHFPHTCELHLGMMGGELQ